MSRIRKQNAWAIDASSTYAAPVGDTGTIRLRSNVTATGVEASYDGAAYVPFGGGSTKWNSITAPDGDLTLAHGNWKTQFDFTAADASENNFTIQSATDAAGTGAVLYVRTQGTTSTKVPFKVDANGAGAFTIDAGGNGTFSKDLTVTDGETILGRTSDGLNEHPFLAVGTLTGTNTTANLYYNSRFLFIDSHSTPALDSSCALRVTYNRNAPGTWATAAAIVGDMLLSGSAGDTISYWTSFKANCELTAGTTLDAWAGFYCPVIGGTTPDAQYGFIAEAGLNNGFGVTAPTATLHASGTVRFDLGSDATGDMSYRAATTGLSTAIHTSGASAGWVLTLAGSPLLPGWAANTAVMTVAGSGTELQYRSSGTALAALTNSAVSGANLGLGGAVGLARLKVTSATTVSTDPNGVIIDWTNDTSDSSGGYALNATVHDDSRSNHGGIFGVFTSVTKASTSTSTTTSNYVYYGQSFVSSNLLTQYGYYLFGASVASGKTLTNYYGLYLGATSGAGTVTNKYGVVAAAGLFNGFGTLAPTEVMHVDGNGLITGTLAVGGALSSSMDASFRANAKYDFAIRGCTSTGLSDGAELYLGKAHGTIGSESDVGSDEYVASVFWQAYRDSAFRSVASMQALTGNNFGASNYQGYLIWSVTADGGTVPSPTLTLTANNLAVTGTANVNLTDSATNAISTLLTLNHESSGTPAAGFGGRVNHCLESSTTVGRDAVYADWRWQDATDGTRSAAYSIKTSANAATPTERILVGGYKPLTDNTQQDLFTITFGTGDHTAVSGHVYWTIMARKTTGGNDIQVMRSAIPFAALHNAATNTGQAKWGSPLGVSIETAGSPFTLTMKVNGATGLATTANAFTFQIVVDSDLASFAEFYIMYDLYYSGQVNVTLA